MDRNWWDIFVEGFTEVRILSSYATYSGYFRDYDVLIRQMRALGNVEGAQVYFVLNQIADACYSRVQCEKFVKKAKQTTTDGDIVRRRWVLIDLDPRRPAGVNSSDDELEKAHQKALQVYRELTGAGFSEPIVAMSGNGYHLLLKVDMDPDGTRDLIKSFLNCLAMRYSDSHVDVDEKVFNAGRICKLYGTMARKGANSQARPWRRSKLVRIPQSVEVTDEQVFRAYVDKYHVDMVPVVRQPSGQRFSLRDFISQHGLRVCKEIHTADCTRYRLEECPFDPNHKNGDAALFESSDGKVGFHCFHNSCSGKTWQDVRELFEPGYKDRSDRYRDRPPLPGRYVQREEPKPKEENEEDGRKWLPFPDIQTVDIDKLPKVMTGFEDMDKAIKGLFYGELNVLSGSNASGKSSWINTLLLNLINQGVKCALWSGELPAPILKSWIRKAAAGEALPEDGHFPKYLCQQIDEWIGERLLIYNSNYGTQWSQVIEDMRILLPHGVRFFVLDNLMALDIDGVDVSKNDAQKKVMLQLKDFAKQNNVIVLLVAHPRKVTSFIRKEDISGSGDITNIPDNVFIIHRVNLDFYNRGREYLGNMITEFATIQTSVTGESILMLNKYREGNVIEIVKNRMYGVVDKLVGLFYHTNTRRFLGRENNHKCPYYGWYKGAQDVPDDPDFQPFAQQDQTEELPF